MVNKNNQAGTSTLNVTLRPRRVLLSVFIVCVVAELTFFLLDWHVNYGRLVDLSPIRNMVNTTREDAVASWFAITQTAFVALTLWLVFATVRARQGSRWSKTGWLILALFFSYMSFDDGSKFHERVGSAYKMVQEDAAEQAADSGDDEILVEQFPSYPWQLVFLPMFGTMGLFMLVFLWRELGTRSARLLVFAGLGCFVLAVGMDFVEGLDEDHPWNLNSAIAELPGVEDYMDERFNRDGYEGVRHFQKSVEETTEMFGMTLLWIAFLRHLMLLAGPLNLTFDTGRQSRGNEKR